MPYKAIKEIGRGGFGIVDLVLDGENVKWARKTLNVVGQPGIDLDDLHARFEREVKYQKQVNHPNVVKIHEYDLDCDSPWFTMELAECSLADEIKEDRKLGGDPRIPLFDLLAGLQAMHEKGFKHRDLKPANVLRFRNRDGSIRYAISDFGLMAPEEGNTTTITASNMGGGTPMYRPPECAINLKRATTRSDIYSVGAILHDIFGAGQSRVPHTELNITGPLGPIIQKCTKSNPRRRYENVVSLREALYEVLKRENIIFASPEEKELVDLLQSGKQLSDAEWDRVFIQIDENEDAGRTNHALFSALSVAHIEHLADESPELLASIGGDYAKYAQKGIFNFDYCDVIANRIRVLFDHGELDLKARLVIALLLLGTSHNRYYVERTFMALVGPDISDALAERIKVEIDVQDIDFSKKFSRLEFSISESRDNLHPILADLLEDGTNED